MEGRNSWNRMERSRKNCDKIDKLLAVQSSTTNMKDHSKNKHYYLRKEDPILRLVALYRRDEPGLLRSRYWPRCCRHRRRCVHRSSHRRRWRRSKRRRRGRGTGRGAGPLRQERLRLLLAGDRAVPAGNAAKVEVEVALHMLLVVGHLSLNTGNCARYLFFLVIDLLSLYNASYYYLYLQREHTL
jgi:hypothetical protein